MSTYHELNAVPRSVPADLERPTTLGLAGGLVVLIFTVVALSGAVSPLRAASVSGTEIVAALTGILSWTLVLLYHRVPRPAARAATIYLALVAWMFGLLLTDGGTRQGVQFIVVQVAFVGALLLASTARFVIGDRLDVAVARCFRFTSTVLIGSEILGALDSRLKFDSRPVALGSLVCMCWFLAEYRLGNRTSLWWSLIALLGIAFSLSRMALFAAFVLFLATMFLAPGKRLIRSTILSVLVLAVGVWAVTSWAPLRDRFVQGDLSFSVAGIKINSEGRTEVWAVLWSEAQNDPLIGHGPGAASALSVSLDPAFDHPHNDYLLVFYDFGVLGLVLLTWFSMRSVRLLRRARKRSRGLIPAVAALNAGLAVLIVMTTDNPLDYPFIMIPLGALIGLGLGARGLPREQA
jgi:O-antigen ligase